MKYRLLAASAVVLLAVGCGTHRVGDDAGRQPVEPTRSTVEDYHAKAVAAHDKLFPEIGARCAGLSGTASPTPTPTGGGPAPENPKYAENHAFKQQAAVAPDGQCRGQGHAARIEPALVKLKGGGEPELKAALTALGYPANSVQVYDDGVKLGFELWIPEAGPCIRGALTSPPRLEVHGVYVEGGCTEPKGGH